MAIKKGLNPRFSEMGKIKIGGKGAMKTSGNNKDFRPPIRYDHFVITTTERDTNGNYKIDTDIMTKLGNDPKEIQVRLLFDDIDLNFHTSFQYYAGSKLVCKGDGETADRTGSDGATKKVECNPDTCEFLKSEKCKVSGILSCQIDAAMQAGAVYRFRTHSWNSVSGILAALEYISKNTNGLLQGLPLRLKMIKKATQDHGNVNIVTLVIDGNDIIETRRFAMLEFENRTKLGINMKQLEARAAESGFLEMDNDTPEDIEIEFYPHEEDAIVIAPKGADSETVKSILSEPKPEKIKPEEKKVVDTSVQKDIDF